MSLPTAIAIYFIVWWVMLFAVLPWRVRSQHESGNVAKGTDPGAPAIPHLKAKLIWTTFVAAGVFAAGYAVYKSRLLTLQDLSAWVRVPGG
jgi:predicted secreted protein